MTCFHPIDAWQMREPNGLTATRTVIFGTPSPQALDKFAPVKLPCGRCVGCRLDRSRAWAVRCMHEASLYDDNVFLTLTYSPEHVPPDGSLSMSDLQLFIKRLRKRVPQRIRYFACGEYGEKLARPHYHLVVFNLDFPDKELYSSARGNMLYTSKILDNIWGKGFCVIGSVTFESAAYVARYVLKKAYGNNSHYATSDGVVREPEFTTMSRRPGIGSRWIEKFHSEVFVHDNVLNGAAPVKVPAFYDKRLKDLDPDRFQEVKDARVLEALKDVDNSTPERLAVREQVKLAQLSRLRRGFEKGQLK